MATTITPPSGYAYTTPQITVSIYPQSGGVYTFSGSNAGILQATIKKNIREQNGGQFTIEVAPGGPAGVNDPNSWTTVINPNSFTVISLSRGGSSRIVMLGIVAEVSESQVWDNRQVRRTTKISGFDFTYYFTAFSFYQMAYLGLFTTFLPQGAAQALVGLWGKMLQGPPNQVAFEFLNYIMLGVGDSTKPGVLDNVYLFYQGHQVFIRNLFGWWFENFPTFVPFQVDVMNSEGRWLDKFLAFLPFPWYEFFVITAEASDYPAFTTLTTPPSTLPATSISTGQDQTKVSANPISVPNIAGSVFPAVIGRENPLPWVEYPATPISAISGGAPSTLPATTISTGVSANGNTVLHNDQWEALNTYSLGTFGFIKSEVKYDNAEIGNFFSIQSYDTAALAQAQGAGDPTWFSFDLYGGVINLYSINTYGYKPIFGDVRWCTLYGSIGGQPISNEQLSAILLGKLASYYIPSPNMAYGSVDFPMWPDVVPGNRFVYNPFKANSTPYMFYIEGVTHSYVFGGSCTTSVEITRGLPQTAYNDPSILSAILVDATVRKDDSFVIREDLNTNTPAYFINSETIASKTGVNKFPWSSAPPVITTKAGLPSSVPTTYDDDFATAASSTSCGASQITPQLLKAVAFQENQPFNPSAVNPSTGATGLMQVLPNSTYGTPPQMVNNALLTNPSYNIMVGSQILCDKLIASGGNLYQALALYGGYTGLSDPKNPLANYVYPVLGYAYNAPSS